MDANADHRGQPFAEVVTAWGGRFEDLLFLAVVVDRAGEGRAETADVGPPFDRVDVVDIGLCVFGELGAVLQRDRVLHAIFFASEMDDV